MPSEPRAAASIVLVHEGERAMFLWARRTEEAPSLRGFHVCPGGLIDPRDAHLPSDGGAHLAARVAALRELFEETGILFAHGAQSLDDEERFELREDLLEGEGEVRLRELGLRFQTSTLIPIGRWITPRFAPIRYDTHFFALRVDELVEPSLDIREIDEVEWVAAVDAHARWTRGGHLVTPPLAALLRELSSSPRLRPDALLSVHGARCEDRQRWEVVPWVQMLPFRTPTLPPASMTNSFLIGSAEALLVEPATPHDDEHGRLFEWIDEAESQGIRPVAMFVTHHHVDHVGAIEALRERYGFPLWAHRLTAERLDGVRVDRFVEADERIVLRGPTDVVLRAIHTPGHAPGHLCLLDEASRAMIVGDMVASEGTILIEPRDGDMSLYLRSLRAMRDLEPSMLLPAHGMPIMDPRATLDHYVAHRLAREEKVRAALAAHDGPAQTAELLPLVYDDAPKLVWPLAALSLEAHLIKLAEDGEVERTGAGWRSRRSLG